MAGSLVGSLMHGRMGMCGQDERRRPWASQSGLAGGTGVDRGLAWSALGVDYCPAWNSLEP